MTTTRTRGRRGDGFLPCLLLSPGLLLLVGMQMAAALLVAVLPQLILSLFVQKYIVRGLTMGATK